METNNHARTHNCKLLPRLENRFLVAARQFTMREASPPINHTIDYAFISGHFPEETLNFSETAPQQLCLFPIPNPHAICFL